MKTEMMLLKSQEKKQGTRVWIYTLFGCSATWEDEEDSGDEC